MAASYTCDGCGCNVEKPKQVGHVLRRDYCDDCAPTAEAFLSEEEQERIAVQAVFIAKREKLLKKYGKNLRKLPDVA